MCEQRTHGSVGAGTGNRPGYPIDRCGGRDGGGRQEWNRRHERNQRDRRNDLPRLADRAGLGSGHRPLGGGAYVYATCNNSSGDEYLLLGVSSALPWQALGSYAKFQLHSTNLGDAQSGGVAGEAEYTYAIDVDAAAGITPFLYEVESNSYFGYYSGDANIAVGSGSSTSYYDVHFSLFSTPTPSATCQGTLTVSPS